jgi:hypothetical protein
MMKSMLWSGCTAVTIAALGTSVGTSVANAQGALSNQGFGYPVGELSTRAQGTAGALSEIDSRSPLNPAALVIGNPGQVYAQYDPETRTVSGPDSSSKTTTARFPNFGFSMPVNRSLVVGLSVATFLDRTWVTTSQEVENIGDEPATATQTFRSDGGITDIRAAVGYQPWSRLRLGAGAHVFAGSNRISVLQEFPDTASFRTISQNTQINYRGTAISGGFEVDLLPTLNLAASARMGNAAKMFANDTVLTRAHIPDRYAASLSFGGIPQTLLAVRYAREEWSALNGLSTSGVTGRDATDIAAGLESAGPRIGARAILLRLGVRRRTLPFDVGTSEVRETSFGGGLGIPVGIAVMGPDRAAIDLSVLRSVRSEVSGIQERAFNFSFGLRVQP